ncbi:hypothetical protein [Paracandidimonas soli]|uniref:Tetratricopeptide repeat protein n=1 Tax=Paracandidimonas soli TaxID=1917182 RepID=A0A4R3UQE2_9BURK|nr:hypothetical protein [Paracandidimonas soli]TCU93001.1 hypothetical protein EV686_11322 [Paracandidimonas soli]
MSDVISLPPDIEEKLYAHGALGREAMEAGDIAAAEAHFLDAWACIPDPKLGHDHAASMAVALTGFYRDAGRIDQAGKWLAIAREAYGPDPDPDTEFLAATVHFAAGEEDEAFDIFDALYRQYRKRPFQEEDPRYLDFYLVRAARRKSRPVA